MIVNRSSAFPYFFYSNLYFQDPARRTGHCVLYSPVRISRTRPGRVRVFVFYDADKLVSDGLGLTAYFKTIGPRDQGQIVVDLAAEFVLQAPKRDCGETQANAELHRNIGEIADTFFIATDSLLIEAGNTRPGGTPERSQLLSDKPRQE